MNIYVSNLGDGATDNDLKELFAAYGEVTSSKVIKDRDTGYSRGFGFVEMANKSEAVKAINELNDSAFKGKNISVKEARPKTDAPRNSYGGGVNSFGNRDRGGYNKKW